MDHDADACKTFSPVTSPEAWPGAGDEEDSDEDSAAHIVLRYVGMLLVTLASAVAISGFTPTAVMAAAGI